MPTDAHHSEIPDPTRGLFASRWAGRNSGFLDALRAPHAQICRKHTPPDDLDKALGVELPYTTPACTLASEIGISTKEVVGSASILNPIPSYEPTGRWRWVDGLPIVAIDSIPLTLFHLHLQSESRDIPGDCEFTTEITTSRIGGREIRHLSKTWSTLNLKAWNAFFSELSLYKTQLRPLQGVVVPNVIGVYSSRDRVRLVMELPHESFWIQASPDMPDILKIRCIEAFQKLHAQGVCHGDVKLSNILIGGDARITLTNFQSSHPLFHSVSVRSRVRASPLQLETEMCGVKHMLDYRGARAQLQMLPNSTPHHMGLGHALDLEWQPSQSYIPERFISPDQSAVQLHIALKGFLTLVERMELMELRPNPAQFPDPPDQPSSSHVPTMIPSTDARPPKYSLRKRNNVLMPDPGPPAKRGSKSINRKRRRPPNQTALSPPRNPIIHHQADGNRHLPPDATSVILRPLPPVKIRDFAYESWSRSQKPGCSEIHLGFGGSHQDSNLTCHSGLKSHIGAPSGPDGDPALNYDCKDDDVSRDLNGEAGAPHRKRKWQGVVEGAVSDSVVETTRKKTKFAGISRRQTRSGPETSITDARSYNTISLASSTMNGPRANSYAIKNTNRQLPVSGGNDGYHKDVVDRAVTSFRGHSLSNIQSERQNDVTLPKVLPNDGFLAMGPGAIGRWVLGGIVRLLF